ncbi:MAG: hypothetical protein C4K58_02775 [Flavobacteriaceae bacterium]|nr:MAG: hypothetical protein C4K58_02775 [Flavobacteriaceae bacterium]
MFKTLLYVNMGANFDWYYWLSQLFLYSFVLVGVLGWSSGKYSKLLLGFFAVFIFGFQLFHSLSTGNGERNHRMKIGLYLDKLEPDKNQWIMLEPAGYIPYYSKLKVSDDIGLVDKRVTNEILKNKNHWYPRFLQTYKPKYVLTLFPIPKTNKAYLDFREDQKDWFQKNYSLHKVFYAKEAVNSTQNIWLKKLYNLKPSARDYYLYIKR